MQNKRKRITAITRKNYAALSRALFELMRVRDYNSITVKEICACAGVPRATFYNYFNDKNELLRYCFSGLTEVIEEKLKDIPVGTREYFEVSVNAVLDYIEGDRAQVMNLLNAGDGHGALEFQRLLCEHFKNSLKDGERYRIPVEMLAEFYSGSIVAIIRWWLDNGELYDRTEIVENIVLLVDSARFK